MLSTIQFSDKNHLEITLDAQADQAAVLENAARRLCDSAYTRFTLRNMQGEIIYACDRSSTKNLHTTLAATRSGRDNYIEYIYGIAHADKDKDNADIPLILAQNARNRDLSILQSLAPKRSLFTGAFKSIYGFISKIMFYPFFLLTLPSYVLLGVSKLIDLLFSLFSDATTHGVFYRVFTETPAEEFTEGSGHVLVTDIQFEQYARYQDRLDDFDEYGGNPGERMVITPSRANYPQEIMIRLGDATAIVKRKYTDSWSRYNPIGYLAYLAHVSLSAMADFCTALVSTLLTIPLWCVSCIFIAPWRLCKDPLVAEIQSLNDRTNEASQEIEVLQSHRGVHIFKQAVLAPPAALPEEKRDESNAHTPLLSQQRAEYDPSIWSVHKLREKERFEPRVLDHIASFLY